MQLFTLLQILNSKLSQTIRLYNLLRKLLDNEKKNCQHSGATSKTIDELSIVKQWYAVTLWYSIFSITVLLTVLYNKW